MSDRTFELRPAVRERVPLIIGLAGPSGGGKTFSALRLATGMQRVSGGKIACVDTESRRALHYADSFKFEHLSFGAPFSPLDYLAAIEYCKAQGASVVIVDSFSHEHEGTGGVLEWHAKEVERLSKAWGVKPGKAQIPAWAVPKAARVRLINTVLQLGIDMIWCFRAKEKIGLKGDKVIDMGWEPITGTEFRYEATVQALLLPGNGGTPTWDPERPGERAMVKLPEQFKSIFVTRKPIDEDTGQALATWAAGGDVKAPSEKECAAVVAELGKAKDESALRKIADKHSGAAWTPEQRSTIRAAYKAQADALAGNGSDEEEVDPETGEVIPKGTGQRPLV